MESRGLMTVAEAAEYLRLSQSYTRRIVASGELPSIKAGRARRIPYGSVQEYISQRLPQKNQEHQVQRCVSRNKAPRPNTSHS